MSAEGSNSTRGVSQKPPIVHETFIPQELHKSTPEDAKKMEITDLGQKAFEEQNNQSQAVSSVSIFSRTWRHIESFFSSVNKYLNTIFQSVFNGKKENKSQNDIVAEQSTKALIEKRVQFNLTPIIISSRQPQQQPQQVDKKPLVNSENVPSPNATEIQNITVPKHDDKSLVLPPSGIPVKGINACYRNASNQAIFNSPALRKLLQEPLKPFPGEPQQRFETREKIRIALKNLCDVLDSKRTDFTIKLAEANLQREIFNSGLHEEFVPKSLTLQLDAPTYIDFILKTVLGYQLSEAITKSAKNELSTASSTVPQPISPCIHLSMVNSGKQSLQEILNTTFSSVETSGEWRNFDSYTNETKLSGEPQDALILQLKRGQATDLWNVNVPNLNDETVKNCFGIPPEVVVDVGRMQELRNTLQAAIYNAGARIIQDPVEIPASGKLDFSFAYGKQGEELNYQINSFIRLYATTGKEGHYVSYVKKADQWYCCNDALVTPVSEQDAKKEMSLAYVYMLERLK